MRRSRRPSATRHLLLGAALLTFMITGCGDSPVSSLSSSVDAEALFKRGGVNRNRTLTTIESTTTDSTSTTEPTADQSVADSGDDDRTTDSEEVYQVVRRDNPLPEDIVVQKLIGPEGGQINIRKAGVRIDFPPGAVSTETLITVTIPKGDLFGYDFLPEGTRFAEPVVVSQDLAEIDGDEKDFMPVYFEGPLTEYVVPLELPPVVFERGWAHFSIEHFSWYSFAKRGGYVIATN